MLVNWILALVVINVILIVIGVGLHRYQKRENARLAIVTQMVNAQRFSGERVPDEKIPDDEPEEWNY